MRYTLTDIATHIGATVNGDGNTTINSLATLATAKNDQIAFLANSKYQHQLKETKAGAVIIAANMIEHCPTNALVMANPYMGYAMVAQLLDSTPSPAVGIHPSAVIDSNARIASGVSIGANAVIESGVNLAENVVIGAGCFIGKNTEIGANTTLWANVSVYHHVVIGKNCLIQANTVIGSDGFGYAPFQGQWHKIPQLGRVLIGDRVEIGASTTIDRGALEDTVIADGCILDNQIQIAHNVTMGENTAMAACSVIAGSSTIGANCTMAGLVGVNGHINVADNVTLTGMTMVTKSLNESGIYSSGTPAQPNKDWNRMNARLRKLDETTKKVTKIEKSLSQMNKDS